MKDLNDSDACNVNGGIKIGGLIVAMVSGAIGGALRGIPGGPAGMISGAVVGAGIGAVTTSMYDAHDINNRGADVVGAELGIPQSHNNQGVSFDVAIDI
jgi:uncharacterized membrane protein